MLILTILYCFIGLCFNNVLLSKEKPITPVEIWGQMIMSVLWPINVFVGIFVYFSDKPEKTLGTPTAKTDAASKAYADAANKAYDDGYKKKVSEQ